MQLQHRQASFLAPPHASTRRLMEKGRVFAVYSGGERKHLLVFFEPPRPHRPELGSLGALCWCAPEKAVQSEHQTMRLQDMAEVLLGKQTAVFQAAHAQEARGDCCVSLVARTGLQVDLEAKNPEQLVAWLWGLNALLLTAGKQVQLSAGAGVNPGHVCFSIASELSAIHTDPIKAAYAMGKRPETSLSLPLDALVAMMIGGAVFTLYAEAGSRAQVVKRAVCLFYSATEGKAGTLYWCEPGLKEQDANKRLALHEVKDIFVGKEHPIFEHEQASGAPPDACLSILARGTTLHLEAASPMQLTAWLVGLDSVLASSGQKVVRDEVEGEGEARKYSVVNTSSAALPRSQVPYLQTESAAVRAMTQGCELVSYENAASPLRRNLFFFYQPAVGRYGSIFWCERGERIESPSNCIPLHTVSDIFLGKQTKVSLRHYDCYCHFRTP
jgi:hypothetical protein